MHSSGRALVRTMPAAYAVLGPMQAEIGARDLRLAPEHATLWSIAPRGRFAAQVNGEWIGRAQWHLPLRDGDLVAFVHVAHGGGGESSPLRIVLQLAVIVASAYTGGLVGAAYGAAWGAAATAAASLAGSYLVNALVPLPAQPAANAAALPSPTYSVATQGNQARLGGSIPVGYGHELVYPDFGAQPYGEFDDNNDQFFCAVFVRGIGHYEILQVFVDDTPLENFVGVEALRVGPGQSTRAGPFDGVETFDDAASLVDSRIVTSAEVAGQGLVGTDWIGPYTVNAAGTTIETLYVDLIMPRGCGVVDENGDTYLREYEVQVSVRRVDSAGKAVSNWIAAGSYLFSETTTLPVRRTASFSLPESPARYQVRIRRTAMYADPPLSGNVVELGDIEVVSVRARLAIVSGIGRDDVTGIVLRMKANEQLSGLSQRRIALLARRMLPVYDPQGQTWSAPVATRNPAHAFADLLHDATYGRGLPDSRIDLDTLAELADLYDARQDRFDYTFDSRITVDDALRVIARAGRAMPIFRRGAIYSMVRDSQQAGPVAAFMPRNMAADSFTVDYILPTEDTPDAVRLTYRSNATWREETVIGQVYEGTIYAYDEATPPSGVADPENIVELRLPGVTGRNHALREAAYVVADSYYRRTRCTWNTELEGLAPAYGSLVAIAHDVSAWAQSGDVYSWDSVTMVLVPAEPVTWTWGEQHYVRVQARDGTVGEAIAVTEDSSGAMVLASDPGEIVTDSDSFERTRFLFGALADIMRMARINGISPQSQTQIQLSAVIEDDRVHEADAEWMGGEEEQDPPDEGGVVDPEPDPETGPVVNLTNRTVQSTGNWPPTAIPGVTIQLANDGELHIVDAATAADSAITNEWIVPQPVGAAAAAGFEVRFAMLYQWSSRGWDDATFESLYLADGTLDAWLDLGTSRQVQWLMPVADADVGATAYVHVSVEIRRAVTLEPLAARIFYLTLDVAGVPAGGN